MQQQAIRRSCMVNGHKSAEINMRCTYKDCQVGQKWMCVYCIQLHQLHIDLCLPLDNFEENLRRSQELPTFQSNKEQQMQIFKVLDQLKGQYLNYFDNLKKSYQAQFNKLTQNEASVQELYTLLQNGNILAFTEQQIEQYNINDDAANVFLRKRDIILEQIKALNTKLVERTEMFLKLSPENVVDDNEKIETESLNNNLNGYQIAGKYRFGVKFGKWTILKQNIEIGGGNYNIDGNKHGEWVDVEVCSNQKYFRHIGIYDNGLRIGNWQIQNFQCQKLYICYQVSGEGSYNNQGNKHDKWTDIEAISGFSIEYKKHIGKYNNGMKIGKWIILDPNNGYMDEDQYNEFGRKHGDCKEVELNTNNDTRIQHTGSYCDGIKVGVWKKIDELGDPLDGQVEYNEQGYVISFKK